MLIRPGRVFGVTVSPNSTTASGVWSLRDMLSSRSTSSWPMPGLITPDTPVASRCEGSYLAASWNSYTGGSVASYALEWRSRLLGSPDYSSSTSVPMSTSPQTGITLMSLDYTYYSVRVQASLTDSSSSPWSNWSNEVKRLAVVVVQPPSLTAVVDNVRAASDASMSPSEDYSLMSVDLELYSSQNGEAFALVGLFSEQLPGFFFSEPAEVSYYKARQRYHYQIVGCGAGLAVSQWSAFSSLTI